VYASTIARPSGDDRLIAGGTIADAAGVLGRDFVTSGGENSARMVASISAAFKMGKGKLMEIW
jgi:hypothetical protein